MTAIEWTEKTLNWIVGCSEISPGCKNCYAAQAASSPRLQQFPQYQGIAEEGKWTGEVRFVSKVIEGIKKSRPRKDGKVLCFSPSMSDPWHHNVKPEWLQAFWDAAAIAQHMTFQILTKRPRAALKWLNDAPFLSNIWLGVSMENQEVTDDRLPLLSEIRSLGYLTFISAEPLLESIRFDFEQYPVDWLIVGGESGSEARLCQPKWIGEAIAQAQQINIPVFVKQLGTYTAKTLKLADSKGGNPEEWGDCGLSKLNIRQFPKVDPTQNSVQGRENSDTIKKSVTLQKKFMTTQEAPLNCAQDKPTSWVKKAGNYTLSVVALNEMYHPSLMHKHDLLWSGGLISDFQKARGAVVVKYHLHAKPLQPGRGAIDPELLSPHPRNSLIYLGDTYDDLIKCLDVEVPWLEPLAINQRGEIVGGNRRWNAIALINESHLREFGKRKFVEIPVDAKHYTSAIEELDELILRNQYRIKTQSQILLEAKLRLALESELAKQRRLKGKASDPQEKGQALKKAAQRLGVSSELLREGLNVDRFIEEVKPKDPEMAVLWRRVMDEKSQKAATDLINVPEEKRKAIAQLLLPSPSNAKPLSSVAKALTELKKQEAKAEVKNGGESLTALARSLGDKPSDNWGTPASVFSLVTEVMGVPDIDVFADLEKRLDCKKHITIADYDGMGSFSPDARWVGKIYGNILYSNQAKCLKKLDEEISQGWTTEATFLCESGVLFNKATAEIIRKHNLLPMCWKGRIEFEILPLLAEESPNIKGDSNRINSVFLYFGPQVEKFAAAFSPFGSIWYSDRHISHLYSSGGIVWSDGESQFLGNHLVVAADVQGYWQAKVNGEVVADNLGDEKEAKKEAIAAAIAIADPF